MKYKNYINSYTKDNRIFSKEDISNMTVRDAYGNKRAIIAQNRKIGVPSDAELRNSSNVIWINPYKRDDGTPVKGHWRSKSGTGGIAGDEPPVIMDEAVKHDSDMLNHDNQISQDEESGDEDISPVSAIIDVIAAIMQLIFKDGEVGGIVQTIAPILKVFGEKIFSDDYLEESESKTEETSEAESEPTEKPEPDDKLTGGASEIEKDTDYTEDEPIVDVSTPEKVQKLMYPDEIAGVKRGEPKTLLQVAQIGVNPNFNPESEGEDYSINCSSAVFAADIQSRGYDVQAVPGNDAKVKELSADISCGYLNPKTGELCSPEVISVDEGESCYNYIQEKFPNDSRGILRYKIKLDAKDYESQDGHRVLVGKGKNGDIIFFDPQDNEYHEGADAKKYMDSWINKNTIDQDSYTFILRIDDKIPDPYYIHEVVRKR